MIDRLLFKSRLNLLLALTPVVMALTSTCIAENGVESSGILLVGDVMLSRNVAKESQARNLSPFEPFKKLYSEHSIVIGNLEGAVGTADACIKPVSSMSPCFATPEDAVKTAGMAGFSALGVENNHAGDLGAAGRQRTVKSLQGAGITPLTLENSPYFFKMDGRVLAVVAYTELTSKDRPAEAAPSLLLHQKIRLARQLAGTVIIYVHWGGDLQDWVMPAQRSRALWLIEEGADMVIGHHPHVIQPPECIAGKPVVYSLGNHVFDQKYPETKRGLAISCSLKDGKLVCEAYKTVTPCKSALPESYEGDLEMTESMAKCPPTFRASPTILGAAFTPIADKHGAGIDNLQIEISRDGKSIGTYKTPRLLSIAEFKPEKDPPKMILAMETQHSDMDGEFAPRPYVYDIGSHGLFAKWRGSALAFPLRDFTMITANGMDYLCALHRGDSFANPDPKNTAMKTLAYSWNGFGFSASKEQNVQDLCNKVYERLAAGNGF